MKKQKMDMCGMWNSNKMRKKRDPMVDIDID